jgi:hypothetical protein
LFSLTPEQTTALLADLEDSGADRHRRHHRRSNQPEVPPRLD